MIEMKAPSTKMKFSKTDKKLKHSHILRPRTAYNYFYKHQRSLILKEKSKTSTSKSNKTCVTDLEDSFDNELFTKRPHRKTHGLISLQQLTKTVAKRWKEASPETREKFRSLAERDKVRYTNAIMSEIQMEKNTSTKKSHFRKSGGEERARVAKCLKMTIADETKSFAGVHNTLELSDYYRDIGNMFGSELHNYTDKLGLTWSADELHVLKMLGDTRFSWGKASLEIQTQS